MTLFHELGQALALIIALAAGATLVGCDNQQTLLDVDTPDGGVEVRQNEDTGEITVDVDEQ